MDKSRVVTGVRWMAVALLVLVTVLSGVGNAEAAKKVPSFSKKDVVTGTVINSEA